MTEMLKSSGAVRLSEDNELLAKLDCLRQNDLLQESEFIRFARNCGLTISGANEGDPGNFFRRGWLQPDNPAIPNRAILFHPFRLYTLHKILSALDPRIAPSLWANNNSLAQFFAIAPKIAPSVDRIGDWAANWNRIVDLAVLLEPLYWPRITQTQRLPTLLCQDDHEKRLEIYRVKMLDIVRKLDPGEWQTLHEKVRIDAAEIDDNPELYLLLRVSSWSQRKKLTGRVAAALWFRHLAEVLRLAFEEIHRVEWFEEDRGSPFKVTATCCNIERSSTLHTYPIVHVW
jgi:hypothetical protein